MKVIFRRSDALAEREGTAKDEELVINGDVQLTYTTLREVETSNPIADSINGNWYIEGRFDDVEDHGPFSDVIIIQEELMW